MGAGDPNEPHAVGEHEVPPEAMGMAGLVMLAVALALIALAPLATQTSAAGKGWYLAPVNWPLLSLGVTSIAAAIMSWRFVEDYRAAPDKRRYKANGLFAFGDMRFAVEYSLYFCLYLALMHFAGFAISTWLFLQWCIWRAGLRGAFWAIAAFLFTVVLVLAFRVGIGLWFPLAPIFKLMPAWIANTVGSFL
jgi:hypothetical protein